MPLAIQYNNGSTTLVHSSAVYLLKRDGIVTAPQLFLNSKPIIYGRRTYSSDTDNNKKFGPVVTSTKWVSFSQDPTAQPSFIDAGTDLVDGDPLTPSRGKCYVPKISSYKKVDNGSNLSVSLTSINNGAISNAALKISSATVANTAYINVIAWAVFASSNGGYNAANIAFSGSYFDVTTMTKTGAVWPYAVSSVRVFGNTSSEGTVDSKILKLSVIVASVKKRSNSLCVMPPFISGTDTSPKLYGWGIILEPTGTNTYPEG